MPSPRPVPKPRFWTIAFDVLFVVALTLSTACAAQLKNRFFMWNAARSNSDLPWLWLDLASVLAFLGCSLLILAIMVVQVRRAGWPCRVAWLALIVLAVSLVRWTPARSGSVVLNGFAEWAAQLNDSAILAAATAAVPPAAVPTEAEMWWYLSYDSIHPNTPVGIPVPPSSFAPWIPGLQPIEARTFTPQSVTLLFRGSLGMQYVHIQPGLSTPPTGFHDMVEWKQAKPGVWVGQMIRP